MPTPRKGPRLGRDPAHQRLIGTKAIQRGRVKQCDARIQCRQQHALALLRGHRRAIGVAEVHTPQADGGDLEGA